MKQKDKSTNYHEKLKNKGFFARTWSRILNIGVDENTSLFDRKRTRLLNGICTVAIISYIGNTISLIHHEFSLIECIVALIVSVGILFLNARKKYSIACHAYNIWDILMYTFMGIVQGANDATELYLIPSSVVAMLFFKDLRTIAIYFVINFACFGIVKYCHTIMAPINVFPEQHNLFISNHILMFVILFLIILQLKSENAIQENLLEVRNDRLRTEKKRSDDLLLNILPAETAEELKATGAAKARSFEQVSVMFSDFKNFTKVSETMSPEDLVHEINYCYSEFDKIVSKHGVEKIKTIGDGYMAAGGLPVVNYSHPLDTVNAALSIIDFINEETRRRQLENKPFFEIRIGIHTGPVVAGVVGLNKFAYDIWGDTVNTASRMESSGEAGKVNISGSTYEVVKNQFTCTHRGKIEAKNKGEIDMYFVEAG